MIKRSKLKIEAELFDEAVKDCEDALDMNPEDRDIRQMLKEAKLELKKSKRKNYYKILKVEKDADDRVIKKAYRKQAMKYHPGIVLCLSVDGFGSFKIRPFHFDRLQKLP